jgi:hypothetical protein
MHAFVKMIKNTHRHPANQALHCIGSPFYVIGVAMIIGHFNGMQTDLALGIAMWTAAVAMFIVGHRIENNIRSMTPILIYRLISRKIARYFLAERIHFLRI